MTLNVGGVAKSARLGMGLEGDMLTVFIYCRVCELGECILADDKVVPIRRPPPPFCL